MEAGSDNGGLEQIGTWGNEYLGQMGIWGKYIVGGIGHRGKWALMQIGTKANEHLGKRGTPSALTGNPKCPVSIFPKCLQMGSGANGHLGQMDIWGKEAPQVPYVHFPKMYANEYMGKWALGVNAHLGEKDTPSALKRFPKCPMPIFLKCLQMGTGANGHLGQMYIWGKGVPPSALCPFSSNVYKWALGQMGTWGKCTFGGKGYPTCLKECPKCPMPISPKCV